jgi:hypothetical protein
LRNEREFIDFSSVRTERQVRCLSVFRLNERRIVPRILNPNETPICDGNVDSVGGAIRLKLLNRISGPPFVDKLSPARSLREINEIDSAVLARSRRGQIGTFTISNCRCVASRINSYRPNARISGLDIE